MYTFQDPRTVIPAPPASLQARRERQAEPADAPIDLAQVHKATNGSFVVEWELGVGA